MLNCVNLVSLFSDRFRLFHPNIISAINSTEDKKMMLKDIYNWIQTNVPEFGEGIVLTSLTLSWIPYLHGFRKFWNFMWCMIKNISKDYSGGPTQASWKNSVRHNLSLHKRFIRVPNKDKSPSFWIIVDENMGLQGQPFRNKFQDIDHYSKPAGITNSDLSPDNDENKHHKTA